MCREYFYRNVYCRNVEFHAELPVWTPFLSSNSVLILIFPIYIHFVIILSKNSYFGFSGVNRNFGVNKEDKLATLILALHWQHISNQLYCKVEGYSYQCLNILRKCRQYWPINVFLSINCTFVCPYLHGCIMILYVDAVKSPTIIKIILYKI